MQLRHIVLGGIVLALAATTGSAQPDGGIRHTGTMKLDGTGTPRSLYNLSVRTTSATASGAAQEFLAAYGAALRVTAGANAFELQDVVRTPSGSHVRLAQHQNGIPVYGGDVVVSLNGRNDVTMVVNNSVAGIEAPIRPTLDPAAAMARAGKHLQAQGKPIGTEDNAALMLFRAGDGTDHLIYRVTMTREIPAGDWEVLVDALSGDILQTQDLFVEFQEGTRVRGQGHVFVVDPLSAARQVYGAYGFRDNNDADSDSLTAYRSLVALDSLTFSNGAFRLTGPCCTIADIEAPYDSAYGAATPDGFSFTRSQDGFEAVNAFYHVTKCYRRFEELGYSSLRLSQIRIDPHGFQGQDNSHYSPTGNWIAFGTGGVDDAEDPDVIWHEYGHAIQYTLNPSWGGGEAAALGEGYADYWAASYARSAGRWVDGETQFNWVYRWDGHNEFWAGRKLDDQRTYPFGPVSAHSAGQIWSAALMGIWKDLGRDITDRLVLKSMCYLGANMTAVDASMALLQADRDLYGGEHLATLAYWLGTVKRFIDPAVALQGATDVRPTGAETPAGFALEQNYPNPFNPVTTIRYSIGHVGSSASVHVTLTVYDMLGREIAVLADGRKEPGTYEVQFDASGISSGMYLCRLSAGSMDETRRMTLIR